jgi:hypothetical protein
VTGTEPAIDTTSLQINPTRPGITPARLSAVLRLAVVLMFRPAAAAVAERTLRPLLLALCTLLAFAAPTGTGASLASTPPVRHVFIVVLENENAANTFAPDSPAPYLSKTLPSQGAFLPNYYGVTHLSLGNYIALVSGQGSNPQTQADCQIFNEFLSVGTGFDGQALGQGCVYSSSVRTIADQLTAHGLTWKGYMEDMGNDPARESATCGHPPIGAPDNTQNQRWATSTPRATTRSSTSTRSSTLPPAHQGMSR